MKKVIEFCDDDYSSLYDLVSEVTSENYRNLVVNNEEFKKYMSIRKSIFKESPILSDLIEGLTIKELSEKDILNLQRLIKVYIDYSYIEDEGMFFKGVEYGFKICKDLGVKIKNIDEEK